MKISREALQAHNAHINETANENYNKAHKLGTQAERVVLRKIQHDEYGILGTRLTMAQVNRWLAYNPNAVSEAEAWVASFNARRG